jgi:hypothetical protein
MENLKEIANKSERKLNQQIDEFNILRDRVLMVAGFGIALLTAVFTFWSNFGETHKVALIAISSLGLLIIAVLIYAAFSNELNRGMDTEQIKIVTEEMELEDYYLNEIAYNLDSFEENGSMLKRLQFKLNLGLTVQAVITIIIGITTYINGI